MTPSRAGRGTGYGKSRWEVCDSHASTRLDHPRGTGLFVAQDWVGAVWLLERRDFIRGQFYVDCGDCLLQMREFRCADDRGGDAGGLQDPGAGDLRRRDAALFGDLLDHAQDFEIVFAEVHVLGEVVGLGARGRTGAAFFAIAGQESARERAPWNQPDAVVDAQRIHLALLLAINEVVMVLHRDEPVPSVFFLQRERLGKLPRRHRARAEVAHLAGAHQRVERLERFFDRRRVVPWMDLVEVDEIHLEAAQRCVTRFENIFAAEARAIQPRRHRAVDLGRDYDLVPLRHLTEPSPGDLLACAD